MATRQRSEYPLDLNGSETRFPSEPCCLDCRKTLDQCDIRFPASHSFVSYLIACEAVQICASPTFYFPKDTRHFPIREWLCLRADFSARRILSRVLQEQKGAHFAGKIGECWLLFADSKRPKTVWWTKSRANHSPPPNSVNKPNLGPN